MTGECVECIDPSHCALPAEVCIDQQCTSYGQACTVSSDCAEVDGEECCDAAQCTEACMIPCMDVMECPPQMGCEHGYCLPECADTDDDCADYPGFTCQHPDGGVNTLCENDV